MSIVEQTFKYRVYPTEDVAREARRHINICREVYNHARGLYDSASDGNKPTYTQLQNKLPAWKHRWNSWKTVNSKCLQMAVRRIFSSLSVLKSLKSKGYNVGKLKWKPPQEYRSIVFNQSGFDVDSNTGRTEHAALEQDSNGRNIASVLWSKTIKTFERHGDKNGCHVVTVPPEGTTKRCARCNAETDKTLWVREHSCPACEFEADRDENASYNVLKLGLDELGIEYDVDAVVGLGEAESMPGETALPTGVDESDNSSFRVMPAKRVVETGSHGSPDPW